MAASRGGEVDLQADDFDTTLEKEEECYGCTALCTVGECRVSVGFITCKLLSDLWNKYQDKHDPKVAHSGPSHVLASQGGSQTPKLNWDNWDLHNCQLSAGGTYSSLVPCWLGEKYFSRPERGKLEFCPRKEIIEQSLSLYLGQIWMLE